MSRDSGIDKRVGKGIRILSLDSGGPGIYSQLLIIKEYTVRLASDLGIDEGDVYPAEYFDLIGGVGFGGLVAILLGHLWMNVDEAIDALLDVALAIFPDNPDSELDHESRTRKLSESVKGILQTRGIPPDRKMQDTSEESVGCKVALYAATTANISHPLILRNYKPRTPSLNPTIVEAICATMATPSYFSPIKIGPRGRQQTFIGGPRGANNPTRQLLKEACTLFGKDKLVVQIISLGCGRSYVSSMGRGSDIEGGSRLVQEMAADCEAVETELSTRLSDMDAYLRLNVERGMENLRMNEWGDLGPIVTHTSAYVETTEMSETLDASLRHLQRSTGTVTLGEINHPRAAKDVEDMLHKQKQDLDRNFKDNDNSRLLDRLKPVDAPSYYENRSCMKDTRKFILDHIVTWAEAPLENNKPSNGSAPKNIFWLYGSPGLGKTSVANSLCRRLHKDGRLGGSFLCRRDDPVLCDPNRVLPTLLHKLAWMWSPYRDLVVQALRGDPNLNPDWTGSALLLEPLYSLQSYPKMPLVLVVDALDESGDPPTRARLLKCFSEICARIDWLKIVVTSRPEHDINLFFQKLGVVGHDLSRDGQAQQDIRVFTRYRMDLLAQQYYLPNDWPGEPRIEEIVRRSGGLFIFVETLYQFLDDPNPELLLTQVLGGTLGEANAELHNLYSTAIATRIGRCRDDFRLFVQALVAVATHRSLSDKTLASLIGLESRVVSSWVDSLSSLLYRDVSENGGIRARHLSVIEFLTGPTCPSEFRVDFQEANGQLGYHCLVTMTKELEFNICKLETSCLLNADIPNLDDRVQEKIPDALQYSSMHWSSHLCSDPAQASKNVLELLSTFFTGTQLLYWLEVLSLMGKVPVAISALSLIQTHSMKFEDQYKCLVEDALHFVMAFLTPISTSTSHIYISALSFTPTESSVWRHAKASFTDILEVCKGRIKSWPANSGVLEGHRDWVRSVAFSPNGSTVASGSSDNTIRIWNTEMGAAIGGAWTGHTGPVWSVAYSKDGRSIVSGSEDKTIRIWDAQTGVETRKPLEGHKGPIWSVAFSLDGNTVVSGSRDTTVRIWDMRRGHEGEHIRVEGHTSNICGVAYSPNGDRIVSGSDDKTIRIWDAVTGEAVGKPLTGHTGWVWSVAYSPNGERIVSGSADNTIRIWDAQTGEAVGAPLTGHTLTVGSVRYSPNGQNIISGSDDNTIRIWDVETGKAIREPLTGHAHYVRTVAYSADGRYVVSGSSDNTIRIWDVARGTVVGTPLAGHAQYVRSVAYSPDGQYLVSGSPDNTVQIWDAHTGAAKRGPLTGHTGPVWSVAYAPEGRYIVSGSEDTTVRIWDVQKGVAEGMPLVGHTEPIWSVAYSPDGNNVVSGSRDKTVLIWDVDEGVCTRKLIGHTSNVCGVAYSPDGLHIVTGAEDKTVRIWEVQTGNAEGEPLEGHAERVWCVAYSPNGRHVASGSTDGTIRIWDVQSRATVGEPLKGHTRAVGSVAYTPDGKTLISGSDDNTIRIWNAQTGEAVGEPLTGHTHYVRSVACSPDGCYFVSGSSDNTIRIWDAQTSMGKDGHSPPSHSSDPSNNHPLNAYSGRPIPKKLLGSDGWVRDADGLLFWVPEDCRNGLTCPAIMTIPDMGRQRCIRINFNNFQSGTSWANNWG